MLQKGVEYVRKPNRAPHQTRQLLDGPLKHIRVAALAAVLLPLASVAATPASAQPVCASGGVCGTVFNDTNNNGVQDVGETGIENVPVFVCQLCDGSDTISGVTGLNGFYSIFVPGGTTTVFVMIPPGMQASPPNVGDDAFDSDGVPDVNGFSVVSGRTADGTASDFGFFTRDGCSGLHDSGGERDHQSDFLEQVQCPVRRGTGRLGARAVQAHRRPDRHNFNRAVHRRVVRVERHQVPMPDGVVNFDPNAPSTSTTTFSGTPGTTSARWTTTINPNFISDENFFVGAAIPVGPAIAGGGQATIRFTTQTDDAGLSFSWQWSAAVYTYWPSDWNQAMIQAYHGNGLHADTPNNTQVQKSLIQGPRGGGGSNFTGSWSATGHGACR